MSEILVDTIIRLAVVIVTGFLFVLMFAAYNRMRRVKMLFIALGFAVLFVHAILLMPEVMIENFTMGFTENMHLIIHLIGLLLITIGILKD